MCDLAPIQLWTQMGPNAGGECAGESSRRGRYFTALERSWATVGLGALHIATELVLRACLEEVGQADLIARLILAFS